MKIEQTMFGALPPSTAITPPQTSTAGDWFCHNCQQNFYSPSICRLGETKIFVCPICNRNNITNNKNRK